jgi:hypothetical protein
MLVAEYLKIVLYNPVNQNTGKAKQTETQAAMTTGLSNKTNISSLK